MRLAKLIYLLLFLIIVTISLSSCARRTRINPYGLLDVLEEHEILNLRRTRVEHVVLPNTVRFNFYLRNVDFTKADLMAIRDTMSLYLQSDEFIAFVESNNNVGFFYDSSLEVNIFIMEDDRRTRFGRDVARFTNHGIENFNDTWIDRFFGFSD